MRDFQARQSSEAGHGFCFRVSLIFFLALRGAVWSKVCIVVVVGVGSVQERLA